MIPLSSQETQQNVVARSGDGILSLLRKNGLSPSKVDDFIQLNKKQLGPDNRVYAGKIYVLPTQTETLGNSIPVSTISYPIFGPNYLQVKVKNNSLKGAVYYLKSGHGGPDPGAMGKYLNHTLCEDEYAYDVILRLGRNLIENGATVYFITRDPNDGIRDEMFLTADKDEVCYPHLDIPLNQVLRLKQRTNAVNKLYPANAGKFQRMISIHVDARSKGENIDVFFYYDKRSKTGEKAARILKTTFEEKYRKNQPNRGYEGTVSDRDLYVVTHSKPVSVYIELGNIHHARDQQRIDNPDNRQALANWLAVGLIKDYKLNK
jgi:N-acetylmuramoyl-L-alanine amidase